MFCYNDTFLITCKFCNKIMKCVREKTNRYKVYEQIESMCKITFPILLS